MNTFDVVVRVVAIFGVVVVCGVALWIGAVVAASTSRRGDRDAAVSARLDRVMPISRPGRQNESQRADVAYLLAASQLEDSRARHAAEVRYLRASSPAPWEFVSRPDLTPPLPQDDRRLSAGELSAFEDPPALPARARDDRGDLDKFVGFVVAVAVVIAVLCGFTLKQIANGTLGYLSESIERVSEGEGPDWPWEARDGAAGRRWGVTSSGELRAALARVDVVASRPDPAGYDRDVFGTEWTDETSAPLGQNGCDTRNDVLRRDLTGVVLEDDGCVVAAGKLADYYTGTTIRFNRNNATAVQTDHIVPLSYAYDMGASSDEWSDVEREAFANDPRNLVAVDGPTNLSKGDQPPSEWLPPNRGARCTYLWRFFRVVDHYDLAVTEADAAVGKRIAPQCGTTRGGGR